jgi:hypothetical protein
LQVAFRQVWQQFLAFPNQSQSTQNTKSPFIS